MEGRVKKFQTGTSDFQLKLDKMPEGDIKEYAKRTKSASMQDALKSSMKSSVSNKTELSTGISSKLSNNESDSKINFIDKAFGEVTSYAGFVPGVFDVLNTGVTKSYNEAFKNITSLVEDVEFNYNPKDFEGGKHLATEREKYKYGAEIMYDALLTTIDDQINYDNKGVNTENLKEIKAKLYGAKLGLKDLKTLKEFQLDLDKNYIGALNYVTKIDGDVFNDKHTVYADLANLKNKKLIKINKPNGGSYMADKDVLDEMYAKTGSSIRYKDYYTNYVKSNSISDTELEAIEKSVENNLIENGQMAAVFAKNIVNPYTVGATLDVVGTGLAFTQAGTQVGAVVSFLGTLASTYGDIMNDKVSTEDAWKSFGTRLGGDLLTLIPMVNTAGRVLKASKSAKGVASMSKLGKFIKYMSVPGKTATGRGKFTNFIKINTPRVIVGGSIAGAANSNINYYNQYGWDGLLRSYATDPKKLNDLTGTVLGGINIGRSVASYKKGQGKLYTEQGKNPNATNRTDLTKDLSSKRAKSVTKSYNEIRDYYNNSFKATGNPINKDFSIKMNRDSRINTSFVSDFWKNPSKAKFYKNGAPVKIKGSPVQDINFMRNKKFDSNLELEEGALYKVSNKSGKNIILKPEDGPVGNIIPERIGRGVSEAFDLPRAIYKPKTVLSSSGIRYISPEITESKAEYKDTSVGDGDRYVLRTEKDPVIYSRVARAEDDIYGIGKNIGQNRKSVSPEHLIYKIDDSKVNKDKLSIFDYSEITKAAKRNPTNFTYIKANKLGGNIMEGRSNPIKAFQAGNFGNVDNYINQSNFSTPYKDFIKGLELYTPTFSQPQSLTESDIFPYASEAEKLQAEREREKESNPITPYASEADKFLAEADQNAIEDVFVYNKDYYNPKDQKDANAKFIQNYLNINNKAGVFGTNNPVINKSLGENITENTPGIKPKRSIFNKDFNYGNMAMYATSYLGSRFAPDKRESIIEEAYNRRFPYKIQELSFMHKFIESAKGMPFEEKERRRNEITVPQAKTADSRLNRVMDNISQGIKNIAFGKVNQEDTAINLAEKNRVSTEKDAQRKEYMAVVNANKAMANAAAEKSAAFSAQSAQAYDQAMISLITEGRMNDIDFAEKLRELLMNNGNFVVPTTTTTTNTKKG